MFGSSPGVFKKREAALKVAQGYEEETDDRWCIVRKNITVDGAKIQIWYKPCEVNDVEHARKEDWEYEAINR